MKIAFESEGWEDYTSWLRYDRRMLARINRLIADIQRDPFEGIGKPEPLKHAMPGAWSRRLDQEHRLVYIPTDEQIVILQARHHY